MNQKVAPPVGEQALPRTYQPAQGTIQVQRGASPIQGSEIRASREMVIDSSTWIAPLREEMARVIVGQKHLLDRLLIALLTNGHVLLEGVPVLRRPWL